MADWLPLCDAAVTIPAEDPRAVRYFFESRFAPYQALDGSNPDGLITGYYEAELRGSRTRDERYRVPIYARPKDLVSVSLGGFRSDWKGERISGRVQNGRLVPYPARTEIERGALKGQGLELLWVDDALDAFLLHVQGSGRVKLADGSVVQVGYAGDNGHPYVSIGRELIKQGAIRREDLSMPAIRAWIEAHPAEGIALLARNPRFIFFREISGEGPIGAQGVALTPGRSLAVDTALLPLGVPLWLDTTHPLQPSETPLRRLMVAQDTGSAIKGPVRGDFFWGYGEEAAKWAGVMKNTGRYYLLLPRQPGA